MFGRPSFQRRPRCSTSSVKRVGAVGVDDRQPRNPIDQTKLVQLVERLAERARIAEVSAGTDDPIGRLPAERFQHAKHDRLLPFQAERIDAVDQIDAQPPADFLDAGHGVVEIAG